MCWPALLGDVQRRIQALLTPADVARARCVSRAWRHELRYRSAGAAFVRAPALGAPAAACDECLYYWEQRGVGRELLAAPWSGGPPRSVLRLPLAVGGGTLTAESEVHVAPGHQPGHLVLAGRAAGQMVLVDVQDGAAVRNFVVRSGTDVAMTGVRACGRSSFLLEFQAYAGGDNCMLLARGAREGSGAAVRVSVDRGEGCHLVGCEWLDSAMVVVQKAAVRCEQAPLVRSADNLVTVHEQGAVRLLLMGRELPRVEGVLWCEPICERYVAVCFKAGLTLWDVAEGRVACRPVACEHERLCRLPGGGVAMCVSDAWWVTHPALLLRPLVRVVPPPGGRQPVRPGAMVRRSGWPKFERVTAVVAGTAVLESTSSGGARSTVVALEELAGVLAWPACRHACRIMLSAEMGGNTVVSVQCALLVVGAWSDLLQRAMQVYRSHSEMFPSYKVLHVTYGDRAIKAGDTPATLGFKTEMSDVHVVLVQGGG